MSDGPDISEVEQRFLELKRLREEEEAKYGELLSLVDQQSGFPLPNELAARLIEIKDALNKSWDISQNAFQSAQSENRLFWQEVARSMIQYLQPVVEEQKQFNSTLVHLLNEFIGSVHESLSRIRVFHHSLILYLQRLIPVIDSKHREAIGRQEKDMAVYAGRLRDHIDLLYQELDRKMEAMETQTAASERGAIPAGSETHGLTNAAYYNFEEEFRGTRESIKERLKEYLPYYRDRKSAAPVLDLGCGRGEFLELLKASSIPAIGVDSNARMVDACRKLGLEVWNDDLLAFLNSQSEQSLGGIFASQVVEHLPPSYLIDLLQSAYKRMESGGMIIIETVNVASAFSFLQVYTRDLSHCTPCHPETLQFLVKAAGFQNPQIVLKSPVPSGAVLNPIPASNGDEKTAAYINENIKRLNKILFDFQEYAVIASK